ncbi:helix-turn-helix domain-containing protein [Paenibacillus sp. sgz302251]|uniref:helix-turn-helix domain-containing protein n=1 Tax=Paenibacillus sp. sgz302251 TaxID=3414493 RepID=UPI003C7A356F
MKKFTTKQIGDELGVTEETVRRWIRAGLLSAELSGKTYYIPENEVKNFTESKGKSFQNESQTDEKNLCFERLLASSVSTEMSKNLQNKPFCLYSGVGSGLAPGLAPVFEAIGSVIGVAISTAIKTMLLDDNLEVMFEKLEQKQKIN